MRFENKVVVVTGAASGIGRMTAKMFAAEGAKVVGIARRESLLKELEEEITAAGGVFAAFPGDLTCGEDCDGVIDFAVEHFGTIDILANIAGAMDYAHLCDAMTDEIWDNCIAVNLTAPMKTSRRALKYMLENGKGIIVNVGSEASLKGMVSGAAYTASKHGIAGLTKNVAYSYAKRGIRCNAVCPGGVKTAMIQPSDKNYAPGLAICSPVSRNTNIRPLETEEVGNLILFLASDEASGINGALIPIDGGWSAV